MSVEAVVVVVVLGNVVCAVLGFLAGRSAGGITIGADVAGLEAARDRAAEALKAARESALATSEGIDASKTSSEPEAILAALVNDERASSE